MRNRIRATGVSLSILALWSLAALTGCAGSDLAADAAPDDILTHAQDLLEREKHFDATEVLDFFIRSHPGNSRMPFAKLHLGHARFGLDEYVLARGAYEDVVEDYPASPYVEEARYRIARCAYASISPHDRDPSETELAIGLFEDFRRDYPDSPFVPEAGEALSECSDRLARKEFDAGRFYEKQRRLRSAKIQYEYVLNQYPETRWAPKARLRLGEVYRTREKWETASGHFRRVLEDYPGTEEATAAENALSRIAESGGEQS